MKACFLGTSFLSFIDYILLIANELNWIAFQILALSLPYFTFQFVHHPIKPIQIGHLFQRLDYSL